MESTTAKNKKKKKKTQNLEAISNVVRNKCYGHVSRMDKKRLPKAVTVWNPRRQRLIIRKTTTKHSDLKEEQ